MRSHIRKFWVVGLLLVLVGGSVFGYRKITEIQFDRNCQGYLKRAADSNTIELAQTELGKAVKYLEDNNLTEGFTSVVYNTPDEDVGFWYTNLKSALTELQTISKDASDLEKSNMLLKLRESLMDNSKITVPQGMAFFPHNFGWVILQVIGGLILGAGGVLFLYGIRDLL